MHLFISGDVRLRGGGYFGPVGDGEERCSICARGEDHPLHRVVYCYTHDTLEPLGADPYVVCGECLHVYRTEAELVALYNTLGFPFLMRELKHGDEVTFCQFCMHDF